MIYQLNVVDGNKSPIPHWPKATGLCGKDTITFGPGLNVVYGRNGTGKSTLIDTLAALMHCLDDNWSTVSKRSISRFNRPAGLADGISLVHDGAPARYLGIDEMSRPPRTGVRKTDDVIIDADVPKRTKHSMSQGQISTANLLRLLKAEPIRIRHEVTPAKLSKAMLPLYEAATFSLSNVKKTRKKRPVLLLDEVDRSLDFVRQAEYWKQLRLLSEGTQVIVASHSPFAVVANANFIEMTPGYLGASRKALSMMGPISKGHV